MIRSVLYIEAKVKKATQIFKTYIGGISKIKLCHKLAHTLSLLSLGHEFVEMVKQVRLVSNKSSFRANSAKVGL